MLRDYIESRSVPVPFCGCWMWLLSFGSHGYGNAYVRGAGATVAHRVSYAAFKGPIPDGMLIQHSCDMKWCVNPDHLSLGTDRTNSDDKHQKNRANLDARRFAPRLDRKLSREAIADIRGSALSQRVLAATYGVTQRAILDVIHNKTYRELAP